MKVAGEYQTGGGRERLKSGQAGEQLSTFFDRLHGAGE